MSLTHIEISSSMKREHVVESLMPMVKRMAAHLSRSLPRHLGREDLVSAGMVGLLEAASRFDPERSERFVGYASLRIRGAMLDELRRGDIMSQEARTLSRRLERTIQALEHQLGRNPETTEIAKALGVDESTYHEQFHGLTQAKIVSFDAAENSSQIADARNVDPIEAIDSQQMQQLLAAALKTLPEKEKIVLSLYYQEKLTLKEIGKVVDLTAARVCQLHAQAIEHLRQHLETARNRCS